MFIRFCTASLCLGSDCMVFQIRMAPIGTQILMFSHQGVALLKDVALLEDMSPWGGL